MNGPAEAFTIGLINSKDDVFNGEIVSMQASVKIEPDETVNIESLILRLKSIDNKNEIKCKFSVNGDVIEGCSGMNIVKMNVTQSQYGYGYGYDFNNVELNYNITINTTSYASGLYRTSFGLISSGEIISERSGVNLIIRDRAEIRDCSIRAKDSVIKVENKTFKNGKLNFYIPVKNAVSGQGYLIGQSGRERFEFSFRIIDRKIVQNDGNTLSVPVAGNYKIGLRNPVKETALIVLDKINNKISIFGEHVVVENMDVVFRNSNVNSCRIDVNSCKFDKNC